MSPKDTNEDMSRIEEGIPAAGSPSEASQGPNDNGGFTKPPMQRLSTVSRNYDIDGDGELNEVEQKMRDMDVSNVGHISNAKVYAILQEQMRTQKQLLNFKRIVIFFAVFTVILALSNLGTAFAAASLAKEVETSNNNLLVSKSSGKILATESYAHVYGVEIQADEEDNNDDRDLQYIDDPNAGGTLKTTSTFFTVARSDVEAMYADCLAGHTVVVEQQISPLTPTKGVRSMEVCPSTQTKTYGVTGGIQYRFQKGLSFTRITCLDDKTQCDGWNVQTTLTVVSGGSSS